MHTDSVGKPTLRAWWW